MKLAHLFESVRDDIATVGKYFDIDLSIPSGKTGLRDLYTALDFVSRNRAYDDSHPFFMDGTWQRILPYDGRDYCFYYVDGANDSHVETLLRAVQKSLYLRTLRDPGRLGDVHR